MLRAWPDFHTSWLLLASSLASKKLKSEDFDTSGQICSSVDNSEQVGDLALA